MNRLGHGSTSAITHITPESQPQLQCQTAHCSLALKHLGSFRNEELHARKRHLENREELSIHLARFYPSPILSPNLWTQSRWKQKVGTNQSARVTFPWGVNKAAEKAWRAEKRGSSLPQSPARGLTLIWAEIQVWSGAHGRGYHDGLSTFWSAVPSL